MNKKHLFGILALLVFIPQVTFAVWWNPGTWFNNWNFSREKFQQTEITENYFNTPIAEVVQIDDTPLAVEENEEPVIDEVSPVKEIKTAQPVAKIATVVDVCLNIDGVQTFIPAGYSSSANICTLIPVIDACPNIIGVQATIPSGKKLYKNTGDCLTLDEIDLLDEGSSEDSNNYQSSNSVIFSEGCIEAQDYLEEINEEVAEIEDLSERADASVLRVNPAISRVNRECGLYSNPTPSARCNDGTYSYSVNNSGTCSYHGGVDYWY